MPRFHVDASYCTRGGNRACWSTSVDAANMPAAQRDACRAVLARHRGATKIDIRIVSDRHRISRSATSFSSL